MTKFTSVLICAVLIGLASTRVTNLETMKAWNHFRQNPGVAALLIEQNFVSKGVDGVYKDANCYKNAAETLRKQKPVAALTESVGAALAATFHSNFILKSNGGKLSHEGDKDNKTLNDRLSKHGKFVGTYSALEMMTSFNQEALVAANDIILHFIADCNNEKKSNYNAIFAEAERFSHAGVGIAIVGQQTVVTLLLTKGFSSNPVSNAVLTAAQLEGSVDYSGTGQSLSSTSAKTNDAFNHKGKEIYPGLNPANVATNDAFPSTKDDGSVRCPSWVNPNNAKKGGYFRDWALTTEKCVRGQGQFTTTNNLSRIAPFAHKGKCFHRLAYCSDQGTVWVKDREYEILQALDNAAAQTPKEPILKVFADDKTTTCPSFVNGPLLRKRFVQDWYLNGSSCASGTGNFNKQGFFSPKAIAMDHKCFHRAMFCDKKGRVWVRDSEYKTLAEWRAEQH